MTCQFCFNKPLAKATGHNGELVPISCPVCGMDSTSGSGQTLENSPFPPNDKSKAGGRQSAAGSDFGPDNNG
jgi:hypothetical protein